MLVVTSCWPLAKSRGKVLQGHQRVSGRHPVHRRQMRQHRGQLQVRLFGRLRAGTRRKDLHRFCPGPLLLTVLQCRGPVRQPLPQHGLKVHLLLRIDQHRLWRESPGMGHSLRHVSAPWQSGLPGLVTEAIFFCLPFVRNHQFACIANQ